jgi:hypothetical protein
MDSWQNVLKTRPHKLRSFVQQKNPGINKRLSDKKRAKRRHQAHCMNLSQSRFDE